MHGDHFNSWSLKFHLIQKPLNHVIYIHAYYMYEKWFDQMVLYLSKIYRTLLDVCDLKDLDRAKYIFFLSNPL